jgi:putative DNA primase/helicase
VRSHNIPKGFRPFSAEIDTGNLGAEVWQAPESLVMQSDTAPYPIDALPASIRHAVEEVQAFVQAPIEMVAASALTALSIAGQQLADVRRAATLSGPTGLYFLTVAESGERKSTIDNYFVSAIREYERGRREVAKADVANHAADLASWEAKREAAGGKLKKAAADGKDLDRATADLAGVEATKPMSPRVARLIYGDVTIEKLTRNLATSWPAGAIVTSEGGVLFGGHAMGRDSASRTMSALNELWSGATLTVDRATSDSYAVRNARLTMGIQVQPSVLSSFMERERNMRGSGLLARFLFSAPTSTQGRRKFRDAPADWPALRPFNKRVSELLSITPNIDGDDGLVLPLLDFTPEAKAVWVGWCDFIESQLGPTGELANVRDLASKAADNLARLAALFHVFEIGAMGLIGVEAVNAAAPIILWHLDQGRNYLGAFNLSPDVANAAALDRWLIETCQREGVDRLPRRKIQQFAPAPLRDKAALSTALEDLAENHRAREIRDGRQKTIVVNPVLLSGVADAAA